MYCFRIPGAQAEQEVWHVPRRLQHAKLGIAGMRCRARVCFGRTAKPLEEYATAVPHECDALVGVLEECVAAGFH